MSPTMEQSPLSSSRRRDESELMNLREWGLKARMISRENTRSRRFSASNISNLREDAARSFRSNFTISSTASSPGYTLKGNTPVHFYHMFLLHFYFRLFRSYFFRIIYIVCLDSNKLSLIFLYIFRGN